MSQLIHAYTEPQPQSPHELPAFYNISQIAPDTFRLIVRHRTGAIAHIDLTQDLLIELATKVIFHPDVIS